MDTEYYLGLIEEELTWRWDELRQLRNQIEFAKKEEHKRSYRKALVLTLYSHFEGFVKSAVSIYIDAINRERLYCPQVNTVLVAASVTNLFKAYETRDKKNKFFKNKLPDDSALHRISRQVDFVSELGDLYRRDVNIPIDEVVNTESNLWPVVLKKILFLAGLPYEEFSGDDGDISKLVNMRNDIAHGKMKSGIDAREYDALSTTIYFIMKEIIKMLSHAMTNKVYLRKAS